MPTKRILKCKNDGLHLAQQTKKEKIYGNSYFSNSPNASSQSYYQSKLETLKLATRKRFPKILDIGCGWGDFLEVLEKEKMPYLGIDINKEAIDICQKKGLNCQQIDIKTLEKEVKVKKPVWKIGQEVSKEKNTNFLTSKSNWHRNLNPNSLFDAITMFQVIEHLKDPFSVLKATKKLLKKNGVLLITTPNNDSPLRKIFGAKWSVYNEPSHHVFYNKKTLQIVLEKTGYKNIQVKNDSLRFLSLRYILSRLNTIYPSSIFNFLSSNLQRLTSNIPVPTDPLGDIESTAYIKDV